MISIPCYIFSHSKETSLANVMRAFALSTRGRFSFCAWHAFKEVYRLTSYRSILDIDRGLMGKLRNIYKKNMPTTIKKRWSEMVGKKIVEEQKRNWTLHRERFSLGAFEFTGIRKEAIKLTVLGREKMVYIAGKYCFKSECLLFSCINEPHCKSEPVLGFAPLLCSSVTGLAAI